MRDNNSEVYKMFSKGNSYSTHKDRKWSRLTPDLFSNKACYNEVP